MSKRSRKSASPRKSAGPAAAAVHLKKEELLRVDTLRLNIVKSKAQPQPDVQSTLELMYLRILSRVKDRGAQEKNLKQLKTLLDQAGEKMVEILDKAGTK